MIEVEVAKIHKQSNRCVGIKRMYLEDYKKLKRYKDYRYQAFQLGVCAYKVEKLN